MSSRSILAALTSAVALAAPTALVLPASASAQYSVGTPGQIAWVRSAATRFVTAELTGDGASACAILNAPLRATEHGRTCTQRWNKRIAKLLREPGGKAGLRAQKHAIATATVVVHGSIASIHLPAPLMGGANRFVWSENCWMLAS